MKRKIWIILLCLVMLGMVGAIVGLSVQNTRLKGAHSDNVNILEAHYQQAFFSLLDETNDMEIQYTKLAVAGGVNTQREYLTEVITSAEVAGGALSALSSKDINIETTHKFINQAGDFARYLLDSINAGNTISDEEKASILKIRDMLVTLGSELSSVKDNLDNGQRFTDGASINTDGIYGVFSRLNDNSVEYPTLIYDGPFSDARDTQVAKGLAGEEIDKEKGVKIITAIFAEKVMDITFYQEVNGVIPTLVYSAKVNGLDATISLAKKGGFLMTLGSDRSVVESNLDQSTCVEIGADFLEKMGLYNMQSVWVANDDSIVYINYAPVVNGVIMYPDLIKVKVASDNGDIMGVESMNYALNHTARSVSSPKVSEETARKNVSLSNASVGKLCIIPKDDAEILCYEYIIDNSGTYYIYIDANTGEEINILYVLSTSGGDKLI